MDLRERMKQIKTETTCLELVQEIKEIVDGFYIEVERGIYRLDDKLASRCGEISVIYKEVHLLHDKLSKLDKNLGKGVI